MTKIALFAAAQVVMYLLAAFVAWDLAWVVSLGEETVDIRFLMAFVWLVFSAAAYSFIWDPYLGQ